jgi:lycopene cyclase domain-containing protein
MHYLYLLINLFSLLPTLLFSFHPKIKFYQRWPQLLPSILTVAVVFIVWDFYYTSLGVWGFNPSYLTGFYIGNLPIEEILFFLCIPYACLFTYFCFSIMVKQDYLKKSEKAITLLLITGLMLTGIFFYPNLYTSVTFFLLSLMLFVLQFVYRVSWLSRFYFAYLFLMIPFLIVNGILTGTGLEQPVVWYNPNEMIGLRLLSIPVEDVFYGLLMLIGSVTLFESRIKRSVHNAQL